MTTRTLAGALGIATALIAGQASAIDAPKRFQGHYPGHLIVHSVSAEEAQRRCAVFSSFACAFLDQQNNRCEIWLPAIGQRVWYRGRRVTITSGFLAGVRAHEEAHCRGWPEDHSA